MNEDSIKIHSKLLEKHRIVVYFPFQEKSAKNPLFSIKLIARELAGAPNVFQIKFLNRPKNPRGKKII